MPSIVLILICESVYLFWYVNQLTFFDMWISVLILIFESAYLFRYVNQLYNWSKNHLIVTFIKKFYLDIFFSFSNNIHTLFSQKNKNLLLSVSHTSFCFVLYQIRKSIGRFRRRKIKSDLWTNLRNEIQRWFWSDLSVKIPHYFMDDFVVFSLETVYGSNLA
jgi:hypothetical protein